MCFAMDIALYASMDIVDFNMPCACENVFISVYPHDCNAMLHESIGVVDIPNIKLLKKDAKMFQKKLSKLFCENYDLIAKLNESNNWLRNIRILLKFLLKC